MLHASIPISVTASCANTGGTLRDDGSCATDSSTNNHTAITASLTGLLSLIVISLLIVGVIGCTILAIKNKKKIKALQHKSEM